MPRATKAAQRQLHAEASCPSVAGDTFWFPYTPPICRFHHFMWLPNLGASPSSSPLCLWSVWLSAPRSSSLTSGRIHPASSAVRGVDCVVAIPITAVPAAGLCVGFRLLYPEKLACLFAYLFWTAGWETAPKRYANW